MKTIVSKSLIIIVGLGFIACGGGSSEGSSNSGLSFPDNAAQAEPTIENGKKVQEVVAQNQQSAYGLNAIDSSNQQNIALTVKRIQNVVKEHIEFEHYALNQTVDETETCSNGGTLRMNGSGTETSGGTLTLTYTNCNIGNLTINGSMFSKIYNYNAKHDEFENIDISYLTNTTVTMSGLSSTVYKDSSVSTKITSFSIYDDAESMKMTISAISEVNGKKSGQNNAVYFFDNLNMTPSIYQTQGKVYIDNLASFVEYDTSYDMSQTPFVFSYSGLNSGEARYNMADGGKVKIVAESNEAKTYVDADNDGIYELSE